MKLFRCHADFPDGLKREASNLTQAEAKRKIREYTAAGATEVWVTEVKGGRTKWGTKHP